MAGVVRYLRKGVTCTAGVSTSPEGKDDLQSRIQICNGKQSDWPAIAILCRHSNLRRTRTDNVS